MADTSKSLEAFRGSEEGSWADKRKDPRLHCSGWAEVNLVGGHDLFSGRVHNLSSSGCRVWSRAVIDALPGSKVEIVLDVDGIRFRVLGALRMDYGRDGFGVEFLKLSARCRGYIEDLILELAFYQRPRMPPKTPVLAIGDGAITEPDDRII